MGATLGGGKHKEGSTPTINITPLVDVVLVVLIIFMIVTPMVTKTFWLNLPPKDDSKEPPPPSLRSGAGKPVSRLTSHATAGSVRPQRSSVTSPTSPTPLPPRA